MAYVGKKPQPFYLGQVDDLNVQGDAAVTGNLTVTGTTITLDSASVQTVDLGDNDKIRLGDADDAQIYHDGTNTIINNDTGNIAITGSNVGIGTSSPARKLDVNGQSDGADTWIQVTSNSAYSAGILFGDESNGNAGQITYDNTDDSMAFEVNDTERMRITSSGNVGIGTSSPADELHIASTSPVLRLEDTDGVLGGASSNLLRFYAGSDVQSTIGILSSNGTLRFQNHDGPLYIATDSADHIAFNTNGAEAMRIDSSGNLLVGSTDTGGNITCRTKSGIWALAVKDTASNSAFVSFRNSAGTQVGSIERSGSSTNYLTTSDYRLKENVVDMTGAIDRLKTLKPSQFNFISDPDRTVDGFLAHEVQDIVPEAVTRTKDAMRTEEYEVTPAVLDDEGNVVTEAVMGIREVPDYQGIDQSKLVPLLTGALQEAIARIETLEAEVATLKGASA